VGQPAGLIRLGVGGDDEHRPPCTIPAALDDVGMGHGAADRGRRPLGTDLADLGNQRVKP
jgi:hypothetical protein